MTRSELCLEKNVLEAMCRLYWRWDSKTQYVAIEIVKLKMNERFHAKTCAQISYQF